ncbi:hypothetical protein D7S54_17100 [Ralstonia pickettii]|nr:hypothetical protein [Ralstonia pickettii]MBA9958862.1 hypothetical protein [Ralstonia pickettii]MBB0030557.1 hypothetical protein [Ralstonia pickettii]
MNRNLMVASVLVAIAGFICTVAAKAGVLADIGAAAYKAAGAPSVTTVIPPGYQVEVGGHDRLVMGSDLCPRAPVPPSTHLWFMGGRPVEGSDCVVIGPNTQDVPVVLYGTDGARTSEIWSVDRQERNGIPVLRLKRANGEYVADAHGAEKR